MDGGEGDYEKDESHDLGGVGGDTLGVPDDHFYAGGDDDDNYDNFDQFMIILGTKMMMVTL